VNTIGQFNNMDNIEYIDETNFSILDNNTDVWDGELPFHEGDSFPTSEIKERAKISLTNRMLYENNIDEIGSYLLSIFPEIDPMYGWQVREIVAKLGYFKYIANTWVSLIAGKPPIIDCKNADIERQVSIAVDKSNFLDAVQQEILSSFIDVVSAYVVNTYNNKVNIRKIETKNLIIYVNKLCINEIEAVVEFNITNDKKYGRVVEFVTYKNDGEINKQVFHYNDGTIGSHIVELDKTDFAFDGMVRRSPVVVFKHNTVGNSVYGSDSYRDITASAFAVMRCFQNILRISEKTREMIRKVPDSSISKDPITGASTFTNHGTISTPDNAENTPDIGYETPNLPIEAAVEAFDKAIKALSNCCGLGMPFFDIDKAGSNLSAKSIRAMLLPTEICERLMCSRLEKPVKSLITNVCYAGTIYGVTESDISIKWNDGLPKDEKEVSDIINSRLNSEQPTITLTDAISKLDGLSLSNAGSKADEILGRINTEDYEDNNDTVDTNIQVTANNADSNNGNNHAIDGDTSAVWESQMVPMPSNIGTREPAYKGVKHEEKNN